MTLVKVEWKTGDAWHQERVKSVDTRKGNILVRIGERRLVAKDLHPDTGIWELIKNKWVKAGKITPYQVWFLGEGMSYDEYLHTPEAIENAKKLLESLRAEREARYEQKVAAQ
jgi:hypothetical protein